METGNLILAGNCGFCGYPKFHGLFHTCSTAPKPQIIQTTDFFRDDKVLSESEEKEFYRKTLHSTLTCYEKDCDICPG